MFESDTCTRQSEKETPLLLETAAAFALVTVASEGTWSRVRENQAYAPAPPLRLMLLQLARRRMATA